MTHSHHTTHSYTAERINRMCALITALQMRPMTRDEICALIHIGPSGVRKYLADLRGMVDVAPEVCRWIASADETQAYLAKLAAKPARPARRTALSVALRDPARHFHFMADDEHFAVRVQSRIPAPWPVLAHFFNLVPGGVWV